MIICLLSAGQGLYEIGEIKLQENKECKCFQK
jgi:hypothetical protein